MSSFDAPLRPPSGDTVIVGTLALCRNGLRADSLHFSRSQSTIESGSGSPALRFTPEQIVWGGWFAPTRLPPGSCLFRVHETPFGPGWLLFSDETDWSEGGPYECHVIAYDEAPEFETGVETVGEAGVPFQVVHRFYEMPRFFKELPDLLSVPPKLAPEWTKEEYLAAFAQVKEHLAKGDSYQANLTFRLRGTQSKSLYPDFCGIVADDPPPYACFLTLQGYEIASFSPELFFRLEDGKVTCRPMKGTARLDSPDALLDSPKERAENLMIVDMIRNDLGRIAEVGSVKVAKLFEIERHPGILQMTSTVEARTSVGSPAILEALFPCASIVGAPKVETMKILHRIEPSPRGFYCGAIGLGLPDGSAEYSVAIRTLVRNVESGVVEYGVGGGIVWDSQGEAEWQECLLKAEILQRKSEPWALLETLLWEGEYHLLDYHLDRMRESAAALDLPFDSCAARRELDEVAKSAHGRLRVRLLMDQEEKFRCECTQIGPPPASLNAELALRPVCSSDPALRHKTNRRRYYQAFRDNHPQADEVLLWNEQNQATEFLIGNLVVEIGGRKLTPPVSCGLLPGVMRRHLLEEGEIEEQVIPLEVLREATAIWRINSVSGWVSVKVAPGGAPGNSPRPFQGERGQG